MRRSSSPRVGNLMHVAVIAALASPVLAANKFYVGGGGLWQDGPWSTSSGGVANTTAPVANDNVTFDAAATYTVNRNLVSPAMTLGAVSIDAQGAGSITVQFNATGQSLGMTSLTVGNTGIGQADILAGSIGSTSTGLTLGSTTTGAGTVTIATGTSFTFGSGVIGSNGAGTLIQNGGQIVAALPTAIGVGATGVGYVALNGGSYSAGASNPATVVGSGGLGQMNINGGVAHLAALQIGASGSAGSYGVVNLSSGSLAMGFLTTIGAASGASVGNLFATGGSITFNGGLIVGPGSQFVNSGAVLGFSNGSATVTRGTLDFGPNATFFVNSVNALTVTDGTLAAGNFLAASGSINFASGTVEFTNSNFDPGTNTVLGAGGIFLPATKALVINLNTNLNGSAPITINGGTFSTGTVTGNPGALNFAAGTFRMTGDTLRFGAGGLFGTNYTLDSFHRFETGNGYSAQIDSNGQVVVTGGVIDASGGILNFGLLQLSSPSARVGAYVVNYGLLSGTGRVTGSLINVQGAETRIGWSDSLRVEAGSSNDGLINLLGGVADFASTLDNDPTGRITGRGTIMTLGLNNAGTLQLSAQVSDIHGALTQTTGGKTIIAGNSVANFYDGITNQPGSEFRVASGSTAVFFGSISGTGQFTGAGVKDFEDTAVAGPIATPGSTIVGAAGVVAAQYVREASLTVQGQLHVVANGTSSGVSRVAALAIDGGQIDLANNALVVDYDTTSPATSIRAQILSGRAGGAWTGPGLTSSLANAGSFALGYAEAGQLFGAFPATFLGQTIDNTTVLIRFTRYGDANLDGKVNALDFNALANNYGGSSKVWSQGDYNYDGVVTTGDFTLLSQNFNQPLPAPPLGALAPEPSSLGVIACLLSARRRRARS